MQGTKITNARTPLTRLYKKYNNLFLDQLFADCFRLTLREKSSNRKVEIIKSLSNQ
jgi:hypothetical protein